MLPPTPVERIAVPVPPEQSARPPFPWIATAAPVIVSLALWALTGSVFSLLFALLGPVVALGGVIDGARGRRGTARRERERLRIDEQKARQRILEAHERERQRLAGLASAPAWDAREPLAVRVGTGDSARSVELTGDVDSFPELVRLAVQVPAAPLLIDAGRGVGITGCSVTERAVARGIAVQLAGRIPPETGVLCAPRAEEWVRVLPHDVVTHERECYIWQRPDEPDLVVAWADGRDALPADCGIVLDVTDEMYACTREQAGVLAERLARRADAAGRRPQSAALPPSAALGDLLSTSGGEGLSAAIGVGVEGPVSLDLVADGPHALVAGTTGSGKSELLISWVLAMAHGRSPDDVAFLLIDFKGGAAFTPLAPLPHVLATLSDLDARLTRRAIESLRAEVFRRERVLAQHGAREIGQLAPGVLARLVIVVDEFAALVAADPALHEVFTDLAARGRSLGLHLVLCTQRPAGVVRDAMLANIGLRISLRVADRSDSIAMVGDDSASRLALTPRGRAVIAGDAGARPVQIALASAGDAERCATAPESVVNSGTSAPRPWLDPLPAQLDLDDLPAAPGLPFGLVDLPAEQRQPVAAYDPSTHGHLLVLGAPGAGATTLATTLFESGRRAGIPVAVLSDEPADAWSQVSHPPHDGLLIIDGLDALLGRVDPDYRHDMIDALGVLLREPGERSRRVIVTARRPAGDLASLAGLFGSRLLLRQTSREDHLLAGGSHGEWDPDLVPGAGFWRGAAIQVARTPGVQLPRPAVPEPAVVSLASHPVLAVVAARPRAIADDAQRAGARVIRLGHEAVPEASALQVMTSAVPTLVVGDPDAWLADWPVLTLARREWPIVLTGCAPADHRALLRSRELPPPLGSAPGECWLATEGVTVRAVLRLAPIAPAPRNP
ncbi:MAG TPA: FtsK/SpoIIIE domain-containing protein [Pseudolysinimonas sp.]|nr:FtsK/SpoIIIE domain-containing protein [Pseudolysinimonas sp.]